MKFKTPVITTCDEGAPQKTPNHTHTVQDEESSKHNEKDENCTCSECIWKRFREAERD